MTPPRKSYTAIQESNSQKICSTCHIPQSLTENFYKKTSSSDGYSGKCKNCTRAYMALWQINNRDKCNEYSKKWYDANPEKVKVSQLLWNKNTAEHKKEKSREW